MNTKYEIIKLREDIELNLEYLLEEYEAISSILLDLNRLIDWEANHSIIFQWFCDNETSIQQIKKLLESVKR